MVSRVHLFLLLTLALLLGCRVSPADSSASAGPADLQAQQITAAPEVPTPTATAAPAVTSGEAGFSTLAAPSPTFTSSPIPFAKLCSPLADHPLEILPSIISDPYDPPPNNQDGRHMGVDFSYYQWRDRDTIQGVAVQSVLSGVVAGAFVSDTIPYGFAVIIETPLDRLAPQWLNNLETAGHQSIYIQYAHLANPPEVIRGEDILCGQKIGVVGQTGGEGTPYLIPHLHIEMRLGPAGVRFEEMGYYDTRVSEQARQTYLRWRLGGEFEHFDPMFILEKGTSTSDSLVP